MCPVSRSRNFQPVHLPSLSIMFQSTRFEVLDSTPLEMRHYALFFFPCCASNICYGVSVCPHYGQDEIPSFPHIPQPTLRTPNEITSSLWFVGPSLLWTDMSCRFMPLLNAATILYCVLNVSSWNRISKFLFTPIAKTLAVPENFTIKPPVWRR